MQIWGITGIMGSGKSAALGYLKTRGFAVEDADRLSRDIWSADYSGFGELRGEFLAKVGSAYINSDGTLNRDLLRQAVAADASLRNTLEKTTHPHIIRRLEEEIAKARTLKVRAFFFEGTRLVENGFVATDGTSTQDLRTKPQGLILVEAPQSMALERALARGRINKIEAEGLISSQDQDKMKRSATLVWVNDQGVNELYKQIDRFLLDRGL